MAKSISRRHLLQGSAALAGWAASAIPTLGLPPLEADETVVPFTDFPADFNPNPRPGVRYLDTRKIQSFLTPANRFFTVQHYGPARQWTRPATVSASTGWWIPPGN